MDQILYSCIDKGLIPDFILRIGIRALLRKRLREIDCGSFEENHIAKMKFIQDLDSRSNIAEKVDKANEQHYEVSAKFITGCTGPYAKYSSCLFPTGKESLAEAEILMFEDYCQKAQLEDGQDILDLGCGWGSLSLFLAQKYPRARITGLSNSATQKIHIDELAKSRNLTNVEILTGDVNTFQFEDMKRFDRILSIEMFEHMKNCRVLLEKVSTWLKSSNNLPSGKPSLLFIHIFCHKSMPYHFEDEDGWMAQNFFSGGTMYSHDTFLYFQDHITLLKSWYLSGVHYQRSLESWLKLQDSNQEQGMIELQNDAEKRGKSREEGRKMFHRFRVFWMACSELFGMNNGQEWGVGHYLFQKKE